ncbi:MAG: Ig-like domain-containing protein [Clostridia bacterium]|nr:Ig-like domain-containing protein [Clostridia bacterium]
MSAVVTVTSVSLNELSATLKVGGEKLTLTATVKPAGAATVVWTSSDPSVAKVENGVVTALKAGTATITATAGTKSATCSVTVIATPSKPVEMTEEKWAAAFEFGDTISIEQTYKSGEKQQFGIIKVDGEKSYLHYRDGEYEQEAYRETVGEKNYLYSKGYEYWTKAEDVSDNFGFEESKEVLIEIKNYFPFDKFEKGEENGEYVSKEAYTVTLTEGYSEPQTINVKEAKLYFNADGKIVSIEHVVSYDEREQATSSVFGYNEKLTLPEVLEGERVTPAEWTAALAMTDTNYRMGVTSYGSLNLEYLQNGTDKSIALASWGSDGYYMEQMYYTKENGKFYEFESAGGHWMKSEVPDLTDESYATLTGFEFIGVDLGAYSFGAFTYDENAKTYTYSGEEATVVAMFKNKKLVWANMISEAEGSHTIDIVYGDAQVILPTVAAGEQVTDEEWAAAKAMDFDNVEISVNFGMGELTVKKVGDTLCQEVYVLGMKTQTYATVEGGKYYSYEVKKGVWTKTEIQKSDYDKAHPAYTLSAFNKSDFTWNEVSETYKGSVQDSEVEIKFVDKKFDAIISDGQTMYFSYGTATLTLPEEGSAATGGGVVSKPEKDITEEDWQNIFAEAEQSKLLSVEKHTDEDDEEYIFNLEEGYIYVAKNGGEVKYVYAVEDGAVVRYDYDDEQDKVTKTATGYVSLEAIKAEVLSGAFTDGQLGSIKPLYEEFYGTDGSYDFDRDEGYISVNVYNGKLSYIVYNDGESSTAYNFRFEVWEAPYWYDEYVMPRVSQSEWNKAFEMDYDSYYIVVVDAEGSRSEYQKDGNNYRIYGYSAEGDDEEHYYSADGGSYYRYDIQDGENVTYVNWVKTEITEEEFTQATQMPQLGEYDYADFTLDEEGYPVCYRNGDNTYVIRFEYKKLAQISSDEFDISIDYDNGLDMPQDIMTQEEWGAAIAATINSANVTVRTMTTGSYAVSSYEYYFDIGNGIIYRRTPHRDTEEVYAAENGTLYRYEKDEEGECVKTAAEYSSLQQLRDSMLQEFLSPSVLGGQTVAENYGDFEYCGFGEYVYQLNDTHIRITFKGGKVQELVVTTVENESYVTEMFMFHDYDTTDAESELPWWYTNNAGKDEN